MGDLSFRMLGDTFILLEIRQQGLFLCLSEFYLAPRVIFKIGRAKTAAAGRIALFPLSAASVAFTDSRTRKPTLFRRGMKVSRFLHMEMASCHCCKEVNPCRRSH
ncbi:hypothetical protein CWI35_07045 [[Bacillus] caldolyticus]|uniref:Uncharacterized protein n=1 Tax=Bacillus caldolyticus TaxID=1394 RepID=A0ABM6QLJ5_BACCL|nr:hypothetical protein CWI35_07045 [[Bacillus] caldolyticus]